MIRLFFLDPENHHTISQQIFTCPMTTIETLRKCEKHVKKAFRVSLLLTLNVLHTLFQYFCCGLRVDKCLLQFSQSYIFNISSSYSTKYCFLEHQSMSYSFSRRKIQSGTFLLSKQLVHTKISHIIYFPMSNGFLQYFFLVFSK